MISSWMVGWVADWLDLASHPKEISTLHSALPSPDSDQHCLHLTLDGSGCWWRMSGLPVGSCHVDNRLPNKSFATAAFSVYECVCVGWMVLGEVLCKWVSKLFWSHDSQALGLAQIWIAMAGNGNGNGNGMEWSQGPFDTFSVFATAIWTFPAKELQWIAVDNCCSNWETMSSSMPPIPYTIAYSISPLAWDLLANCCLPTLIFWSY